MLRLLIGLAGMVDVFFCFVSSLVSFSSVGKDGLVLVSGVGLRFVRQMIEFMVSVSF